MVLNKQAGNMYPWVTHTWNTVKGKCPHDCSYCYMKRFHLNDIRFVYDELNTDLQVHNTIFIGSSCDMWAKEIPSDWIQKTIEHCKKYPSNNYLFQSKNPQRFFEFVDNDFIDTFCNEVIFGCTLETNREYGLSNAPCPSARVPWMWEFTDGKYDKRFTRMVSIEPIIDFDLREFKLMIWNIKPEFVSIGADSQGHNLPEPSKEKTLKLIDGLKTFTEVKIKDNLNRILKEKSQYKWVN